MSALPTLTTQRLRLRPMTLDDLDALAQILGDAETMRFYANPFSRDESLAWIVRTLERYGQHGFGLFAVELLADGAFIGDCGPALQTVEGVDDVELGWHIRRDLWGRGYATEAARAWRDWVFARLERERVISLISPGNVASQRVAAKVGLTLERLVEWREHLVIELWSMARPIEPASPARHEAGRRALDDMWWLRSRPARRRE
jgi:[ribosomal protein S5]-alanine N-acetyltransferase